MTYDLIIIGGGPAGVSAGVYAARKKLKTLLIAPEFGGQSIVSEGIENWIGTIKIPGSELAENLKKHLLAYANDSVVVKEGESVKDIKKDTEGFIVLTDDGEYSTKTILIATGSTRRKLDVLGAEEFDNKGLTYCASCDGPLFAGQDVVVIGGGNAAFETSAQLLAYCKSVTLLNRSDKFKADEITINRLKENSHFKVITNAIPKEIKGDKFVSSIVYEDAATNETHEIQTPAVFVEIGLIPTTYFAKNIINLNQIGQIPVNPKTQQTEVKGIWAAGDCTDGLYHQNNIASGDAVKALEDIYVNLHTK
ncbi:MAG: thioredoxin reductase (NADPH) [Parcubacteria bacterium C7867-006]|nr:MAG: thioredoxin reductase (NADPH) [Parcubacteria bacterium C7867-006]